MSLHLYIVITIIIEIGSVHLCQHSVTSVSLEEYSRLSPFDSRKIRWCHFVRGCFFFVALFPAVCLCGILSSGIMSGIHSHMAVKIHSNCASGCEFDGISEANFRHWRRQKDRLEAFYHGQNWRNVGRLLHFLSWNVSWLNS